MSHQYWVALTAMILTTGLNLSVTNIHAPQVSLISAFKNVLAQQSLSSLSPQLEAESSPTDRGATRDRKGGASHLI
jgi:hypothetical protein